MPPLRIVGISGNLTRPSRTRTLVGAILRQVEDRGLGEVELFDLVDAGPELGAAVERGKLAAAPDRVLTAIETSDVLVVATPVYKAAYTGLLKHLFDLIDPTVLDGRPVVARGDRRLRPARAGDRASSQAALRLLRRRGASRRPLCDQRRLRLA